MALPSRDLLSIIEDSQEKSIMAKTVIGGMSEAWPKSEGLQIEGMLCRLRENIASKTKTKKKHFHHEGRKGAFQTEETLRRPENTKNLKVVKVVWESAKK